MKKELVNELNGYLANLGVMYVKLHNLHWNVVGLNFKAVHEYLEGLYDQISDSLDEVAELLKKNNEMPLASLKDYLNAATIKEVASKEVTALDAIATVKADYTTLKNTAEAIRSHASEVDDYQTVGLMEDELGNYIKVLWFLNAMEK